MTSNAAHNLSLAEMDRQSFLHPVTSVSDHQKNGPHIFTEGSGARIRDIDGRSYIDGMGGLWCVNVGYGRESLAKAAAAEMGRMGYYHTFAAASSEPMARLADRLRRLINVEARAPQISKVTFGLSGSDANDTQVKIVRYYNNVRGKPAKKKIISRHGAYHGLTVAAGSLTGIPIYHKAFDLPTGDVIFAGTPHYYWHGRQGETEADFAARLALELEAIILREGPDTVAAFIAEPIMGTGGVLVPPAGYFERVQQVLDKYDVLFIVDEVICGFGRLGSWFGTTHFDLKPDLMSFAKGLTSGYFPMSAVAVSDKIWEAIRDGSDAFGMFAHGFTYSGHPAAGAVAMANLDIIEGEGLVAHCARVGSIFKRLLQERIGGHPNVAEIRGEGLMIAVEFVADRATKRRFDPGVKPHHKVVASARQGGLIIRPLPNGDVCSFAPPLVFSEDDAERAAAILGRAVDDVFAALDA
ncbi:MAG: aminotransferase [Alphaproteobacteria bacterium]